VTIGDPQANGQAPKFVGTARFKVISGDPVNGADNKIDLAMSDIRNKAGLADYTGEMRAQMTIRTADKTNGSSGADGATVQDFPFSFNVPCFPTTSDSTVGSDCEVHTTADTLFPGMVPEGKRAVTHVGDFRVYDGGSDGDGDTPGDNTAFAWEGLFTP
jgi:hypothetical protein